MVPTPCYILGLTRTHPCKRKSRISRVPTRVGGSQINHIPDVLSEGLGEVNPMVSGDLTLELRG
jgi:hypothetical protein